MFGKSMYLFGGSYNFNSNDNLYILDMNSFKWDMV